MDSVEWDEPVTDEDEADSRRCTDDSWCFECKQQMAKAWSDIDETESAAELPCICEQDVDAKVDEAFMSTAEVKEADYSSLTDTDDENAAGEDVLSGEMGNDASDDESLWVEVSDCDTAIHRDPSGEEGWNTGSDFEVSDCDTVIRTDQNGEESWDTGSDFEVVAESDLDW